MVKNHLRSFQSFYFKHLSCSPTRSDVNLPVTKTSPTWTNFRLLVLKITNNYCQIIYDYNFLICLILGIKIIESVAIINITATNGNSGTACVVVFPGTLGITIAESGALEV